MKKILFTLLTILICLNIYTVKAEENEEITELENVTNYEEIEKSDNYFEAAIELRLSKEEENYGVRKPAKIDSNSIPHIKKTPLVDSSKKVYDFSNVLEEDEEESLRKKAIDFLDTTGIELIIVTVHQNWSDSQIEEFAEDFFDFNDFGISENSKSYDGILAIRNTSNYNRYYYVSTSGMGQIYFPSDRVEDILDDMYDNMHIDNYYYGFINFINSAKKQYDRGVPSKYKDCYVDQMGDLYDKNGNPVSWEKGVYRIPFILAGIIAAIVSIIVISIMIAKNKMVKKAVNANDYID